MLKRFVVLTPKTDHIFTHTEREKQLAQEIERHEIEQATEAALQRGIARRERELKRDYEETGICPTCGNGKST